MSRWLVTGAGGRLGRTLCRVARDAGHEVTATTRTALDITDASACEQAVAGHEVVVNTAAWTAVDAFERHQTEAFAVNAVGPANVARACDASGARLVHLSTHQVFAGTATRPYPEDARPDATSAYGRSKAAGESAVRAYCPTSWIVRSAWLYGPHGDSFVRSMARLAVRTTGSVPASDDRRGQPTSTADLSGLIVTLVDRDAPFGAYHATNSGDTTHWGLARAVFELLGHDPDRVTPSPSDAAPGLAYGVLGHDAWTRVGLPLPTHWYASLERDIDQVVDSAA